jgi:hypothetical protein
MFEDSEQREVLPQVAEEALSKRLGKFHNVPRAWVELWELGWSMERIAETWHHSLEYIEAILNELSMGPLPLRVRRIPALPVTKEKARERRDVMRLLYKQGWSIERLVEYFFYYSPEVMQRIVKQPLETKKAKAKEKALKPTDVKKRKPQLAAKVGQRICPCGCKRPVNGRRKWARESCRKRKSVTSPVS